MPLFLYGAIQTSPMHRYHAGRRHTRNHSSIPPLGGARQLGGCSFLNETILLYCTTRTVVVVIEPLSSSSSVLCHEC